MFYVKYDLEPMGQTGLLLTSFYRDAKCFDLIVTLPDFCETTDRAKERLNELIKLSRKNGYVIC